MSESVLAASDFSLETSWKQAEKGTLSPFECLSFANTIQADLPTCVAYYDFIEIKVVNLNAKPILNLQSDCLYLYAFAKAKEYMHIMQFNP